MVTPRAVALCGRRSGMARVKAVVLALALIPAAALAAEEKHVAEGNIFEEIADEILVSMKGKTTTNQKLFGRRPKVAILPFREDDIPISPGIANEYNAELLASLIRKSSDEYHFLPREELSVIIQDMTDLGEFDDGVESPRSALLKNARADITVMGTLRLRRDAISLSYKVVGTRDAEILATTKPRRIPLSGEERMEFLTLDQAVSKAAKYFTDNAHDMAELRLAGLRFGDSGIQTPFGPYFEGYISDALKKSFSNVITGGKLIVSRAELTPEQVEGLRGTDIAGKTMLPENFDPSPGVYVLSGNYWDFGVSVEISVSLKDGGGRSVAWRDRVIAESFPPGLEIRPAGNFGMLRENDGIGPIEFNLSSDRGKDPAYRIGEKLNLLIKTDRDAWLYCFYRQTDRRWVKLFPNTHHTNASVPGSRMLTIPGVFYPFDMTIMEPLGADLIKCFATTRDVTESLPEKLKPSDGSYVPAGWDAKLLRVFRSLENAGLTEASLVVTVRE